MLARARGVLHLHPGMLQRPEGQHALEGEAAREAGRHAAGELRRLDGDGAGTAHRVEERAVLGPAAPAGGGQQGGGEGLLERRLAGVVAPAALEERLAREVGVQRSAVLAHEEHERQEHLHRRFVGRALGALKALLAQLRRLAR